MPNYCSYSMCVRGTKANVEEFIKVIQADYDYHNMEFSHDRHMFRVFDADCGELEECLDGTFRVEIIGCCAWSVGSCMLEEGYYREIKNEYPDNFRGTTLLIESEKLNLNIEVYSEESGCCFQEHYVIKNGEMVCDECVEWEEYFLDEYETKEQAEEELGVEFTDEEWENRCDDRITRGGFDNWGFEF